MRIVQFVKKLNNTELGKGGTHDTYVLVPNELDLSEIFPQKGQTVVFTDRDTRERVAVRITISREKRIVGLGQYYRSKELCAGDEIIFEKRTLQGQDAFFVSVKQNVDSLVFQKSRHGFELLTPERLFRFLREAEAAGAQVEIPFLGARKKRNDSPEDTEYYDIIINGESILDRYSAKEIGELRVHCGEIRLPELGSWKKYVTETEGFR